ncbi:hypothetical protein LOZ66_004538 [Ophidiomyces ophidiicola]|nr:hypothetical protein LOZ65_002672 [Ophidiomyces ophidiicola]KAI1936562.1 hypothetical protein LOZ66_004538 [Ophidiomyces ophidiicola]
MAAPTDSSSPANLTSVPTTTPQSTQSLGSSPRPSSNPDSNGLPTALKAGIGVAVGFSILSCVILLAICVRKRRHNKEAVTPKEDPGSLPPAEVAWPSTGEMFMPPPPQEMAHSPRPRHFELAHRSVRLELAGDMPPNFEPYKSEYIPDIKKMGSSTI